MSCHNESIDSKPETFGFCECNSVLLRSKKWVNELVWSFWERWDWLIWGLPRQRPIFIFDSWTSHLRRYPTVCSFRPCVKSKFYDYILKLELVVKLHLSRRFVVLDASCLLFQSFVIYLSVCTAHILSLYTLNDFESFQICLLHSCSCFQYL